MRCCVELFRVFWADSRRGRGCSNLSILLSSVLRIYKMQVTYIRYQLWTQQRLPEARNSCSALNTARCAGAKRKIKKSGNKQEKQFPSFPTPIQSLQPYPCVLCPRDSLVPRTDLSVPLLCPKLACASTWLFAERRLLMRPRCLQRVELAFPFHPLCRPLRSVV